MSESMKLDEVIAEGIENKAQRSALLEMNYRLGQGFMMHKPLTKKDFYKVLRTKKPGTWTAQG